MEKATKRALTILSEAAPQSEQERTSVINQICKELLSKDIEQWDWGSLTCSSKVEVYIEKMSDEQKSENFLFGEV